MSAFAACKNSPRSGAGRQEWESWRNNPVIPVVVTWIVRGEPGGGHRWAPIPASAAAAMISSLGATHQADVRCRVREGVREQPGGVGGLMHVPHGRAHGSCHPRGRARRYRDSVSDGDSGSRALQRRRRWACRTPSRSGRPRQPDHGPGLHGGRGSGSRPSSSARSTRVPRPLTLEGREATERRPVQSRSRSTYIHPCWPLPAARMEQRVLPICCLPDCRHRSLALVHLGMTACIGLNGHRYTRARSCRRQRAFEDHTPRKRSRFC